MRQITHSSSVAEDEPDCKENAENETVLQTHFKYKKKQTNKKSPIKQKPTTAKKLPRQAQERIIKFFT